MEISLEEHIIQALAYFDIFDYPLTFYELKMFVSYQLDISDEQLLNIIHSIPVIQGLSGYYYFLGRHEIVGKRIDKNEISISKLVKAKVIAKILSKIPTIEYIGVSGSLSMNNAGLNDDIDLFFITKKNTLWISRIFINYILIVLRQKRSRSGKDAKDKICPNMFMELNNLSFQKERQSYYLAHEIVQLKTLFDRNNAYPLFISKNKWVKEIFPNFSIFFAKRRKKMKKSNFFLTLIKPLELLSFTLQKMYMRNHETHEIVKNDIAMFHPNNKEKMIQDLYNSRVERYSNLYFENQWIDNDDARFYFDEKKIRILN